MLVRADAAVDVGKHRLVTALVGDASAGTAPKISDGLDESRKGRGRGSPPLLRQARPVASTASSTYRRALSCSAVTTQQRCDLRTGVSRLIPWQEPDRHRALTDALTRDPDRMPGGRRRCTIRRSTASFHPPPRPLGRAHNGQQLRHDGRFDRPEHRAPCSLPGGN